ncbi:MAG: Mrp/NBP35 family ATP-binding protein [Neisseriaceae bacterium]|nr:Mrp/NBP35 family ATP-binding protein [Neisseriaceae bacterium]
MNELIQKIGSLKVSGSLKTLHELHAKIAIVNECIHIDLPFPVGFADDLTEQIAALTDKKVVFNQHIITHKVKHGIQTHPEIKNVIAVASGKGGVGKSTVTAQLALALSKAGAKVGIMDADLYGPSVPTMFGLSETHLTPQGEQFVPPVKHDIQLMSIGFLMEKNRSLVWRGALVNQALQQMFFQTAWDHLDYLLIDLPPGTGDVQLTLTQKIPLTASIVVSTPQEMALADARRAVDMFAKTATPVLGVVENMSLYICPCCGEVAYLFGKNGGNELAGQFDLPLLGQLPIHAAICTAMDKGEPQNIDEKIRTMFHNTAAQIAFAIAQMGKDYSQSFAGLGVSVEK